MTRAELEKIKAKAHGPDVDALIFEIENLWSMWRHEMRPVWSEPSHDLLIQIEGMPDRLVTVEEQKAAIRKFVI